MKGRFRVPTVPYRSELLGIFVVTIALFLLVALMSSHTDDPSLLCWYNKPMPIRNWAGFLGAHIAALLLYGFGMWAIVLPMLLGAVGISLLAGLPYEKEWDRLVAFGLLLVVGPTWSAYYKIDVALVPGGLIGVLLARACVLSLDALGTFFVIHGALLASLLVTTRISFMMLLQMIYSHRKKPIVAGRFAYRGIALVVKQCKKLYRATVTLLQGDEVREAPESLFAFQAGQEYIDPIEPIIPFAQTEPQAENPHEQLSPEPLVEVAHTYALPEVTLFEATDSKDDKKVSEEGKERARLLEEKLSCFGVHGKVVAIRPGPVVTLYEYEPAIDTKLSKIIALEDDLALALQATSIRILAPIPGTAYVGFEVANNQRKSVLFSTMVRSKEFKQSTAALPLILGVSTTGVPLVADLSRMPHLLVAGSTGSGKSVALHTMLTNLLCTKTPDELQMILIDPKRLEFACYADVPHLLFPVVTDPRMAIAVLRWAVQLMDKRYERMAHAGVRSVADYRATVTDTSDRDARMPYLVIVIDEFADLMMTAGSDVEDLITRLSQMARAAGIHLILATQRPSVDVITGLIKVNFPSRIALRVTSKIDSRTILDCGGADKLLGRGDQLFLDGSTGQLHRIHGAYISDAEISLVVNHVRSQRAPNYLSFDTLITHEAASFPDADDELYDQIVTYLQEVDEVSISMVQRRFKIGYNRSARIIEALQAQGKIMPAQGSKPRKVIR
jgi:DNA segregation ATPase FtsK/SpoIIIE, S-DNA-T family